MTKQDKVQANNHPSYGVYTLIGLLIPPAGIIMGAIMLTKENALDKKLGEHAIVISIIGFFLAGLLWYFLLAPSYSTEPVIIYP